MMQRKDGDAYEQVESLVYGSHSWRKKRLSALSLLLAGFGLDTSFSSESETASASAMVKLTPELLAQAPSAINPVRERQLDLRGESSKES